MSEELPVIPEQRKELHIVDVRSGSFNVTGSGDTSGFGGLVRTFAMPGATSRPYGSYYDEIADVVFGRLEELKIDAVEYPVVDRGEFTLFVRREHLLDIARILRDDEKLRFEVLQGVSGVHYPTDGGRELHTVTHLLSMTHNRRIRLEVTAPESDPHIPSLVSLWPNADWHERETYDFFGIVFEGHPDLRRILLPDGWEGHPLRRTEELGGVNTQYRGAFIPPVDRRTR